MRKPLLLALRQVITEADKHRNFPILLLNKPFSFETALLLTNVHEPGDLGDVPFKLIFSFTRSHNSDQGSVPRLDGRVTADPRYYDPASPQGLCRHFGFLLKQAVTALETPLNRLELLSPDERETLLRFANGRETVVEDRRLHCLVLDQIQKTPLAAAAVLEHRVLTYRQLGAWSYDIAAQLAAAGVTPGDIVALMAPHSLELLAAILGI